MIRSSIVLLLLSLGTLVAEAQQFTTPTRVNHDKSLGSQRSPMMKTGRNQNIYVAWVNANAGSGGAIQMSVSTDGGETFSGDVTVCADANCNADFQRTAQFVLDTKDHIHLIWMGNRVRSPINNQLQSDIWYVRSTDNGATWTTPVSVCDADDSSIYAQDFPSIACDSSDNLYVTFLDSRETQRTLNANVHLYFTKSSDGGVSWSTNRNIESYTGVSSGGTCECCTQTLAASPDGNLYAVFRSNISDLRDIWLLRSSDKGDTWQPGLKVSSGDWHISACPVSGPCLALDESETVHVAWRDARDDSSGISHTYYAAIPKGSMAVPANTAFDAAGAELVNYPSVALYAHSKYRVITYQTSNYGMRYILYADGIMSVKNRPIPTGGKQEFGTVLFGPDGTRYLCWQDGKSDPGDIYFCKEISPLPTAGVAAPTLQTSFALFPNPLSGTSKLLTITLADSQGSVRIIDLKGATVLTSKVSTGHTQIDCSAIAEGTYVCVFEQGGLSQSQLLEIR